MELVSSHWSGKHQRVVKGINLITMLWIENDGHLPCYERTMTSRMTKMSENAHFRSLRQKAKERGFQPACVLFDSWYSNLDNLKAMGNIGWIWLTKLKMNGLIKAFETVSKNGGLEYWVTKWLRNESNQPTQTESVMLEHRRISSRPQKFVGVEWAQVGSNKAQRNHIGLAYLEWSDI